MEKVFKLVDDLNPILRNTLLVIGLLWILKIVFFHVYHFFIGFRLFIYSRCRHLDLTKIYGELVVITGATDGIGLEFARQFAQRGHSIALIGRNEEKLKHAVETVSQLLLPGKRVFSIQLDLNNDDVTVYHNIKNELQEYANDIGILINNAGVLLEKPGRYLDLGEDEVMQNVRVNISAVLMVTRAVLPFMVNNKRGLIINMSSAAAVKPLPYTGVYSASKKFVEYFGSALGYEYKNDNIHVLTFVPSYISTKMVKFSKFLSKPSIIIPSAKTFVSSAISTIGHTEHTTGFWAHGIYWFFTEHFAPMFAYQFFAAKFLTSQKPKEPKVESSRV